MSLPIDLIRKRVSLILAVFSVSGSCFAQSPLWTPIPLEKPIGQDILPVLNYLDEGLAYRLDTVGMEHLLSAAPFESPSFLPPAIVLLPVADGTLQRFKVKESPILSDELAARIPIRTYVIQGLDDKSASGRIDFGHYGFHGAIFSPRGDVIIDPIRRNNIGEYVVYFRRDSYYPRWEFACLNGPERSLGGDDEPGIQTTGPTLKTYRLALNTTGEYTAFFGGAVPAEAGAATSVNRVTGIYEKDCAIRLNLTYIKCYTNSGTDPFTNGSGSTMLGQNQSNLDSIVGNSNYDIGHVFSTGGGGVAGLGVVGITGQKAKGVTGSGSPIGDNFDIDYVAHEMGHQYGGRHSFNGTTSNCGGGNRDSSSAYEPGSGSTIMGYAGICGTENIQPHSDAYFHTRNIDQIVSWRNNAGSGGTSTNTGNNAPTVSAGADFGMPIGTPFKMTATAYDPNSDPLTYCWEQTDLGTASPTTNNATRPLFRTWNPSTSPTRFFPRLIDVLANVSPTWEILPTVNRNLTMRCTVRDNRTGGGGVETDAATITVSGTAMVVTSPNTNVQWIGGSTQAVTWTVGGSAAHSANVNILLSTNGGTSYGDGTATILASNVPNDGSQAVVLPNITSTTARIFVESSNSKFFDVSNVNFSLIRPIISGNVALGDYVGLIGARPVTLELMPVGSSTPIQSEVVTLGAGGTYSFYFKGATLGTYDLYCKGTNWLRKIRSSVSISASGVSAQNFALINGDVDDDNEVTLVDAGMLSSAFGSTSEDGNWLLGADLDGDDEVNLVDASILASRFGQSGN